MAKKRGGCVGGGASMQLPEHTIQKEKPLKRELKESAIIPIPPILEEKRERIKKKEEEISAQLPDGGN